MSRKTERESDTGEPAAADAEEHLEATEGPRDEGAERLAGLEAEVTRLRELAQRAQADYQNLRRRSQAEHEAGLKRTLQPLLQELLLVLDYLDLALASPTDSPDAKNLAVGVEMTRAKLLQALESVDVHPIVSEGPFDPTQHEAVASRSDTDAAPGTILSTERRGFTWREGVLRPARVVVAAESDAGPEHGERHGER